MVTVRQPQVNLVSTILLWWLSLNKVFQPSEQLGLLPYARPQSSVLSAHKALLADFNYKPNI